MSLFLFSLLFFPPAALICAAGYYAIRYTIEIWKLPAENQIALGVLGVFALFARKFMPGSTHYYLKRAFILSVIFIFYVGLLAFFIDRLGKIS
ncbi:hypothetical protein J7E49_20180 [Variovorax paradoxus]|nr:hypothetical protein [Variovorax paradoxus]